MGVIGVSGDPSTVMSLAKLIKLSFESLYDYELQREFLPTASTGAMSHLARLLFVDRPVNIMRIRSQAAELGITEHVNRYPLLIEYVGCEAPNWCFPALPRTTRIPQPFSQRPAVLYRRQPAPALQAD